MIDSGWERVPLRDVAARFGTPLVVLSEDRLRANVRDLVSGLGAGAVLRYCAKTNPEPRLLEIVRAEGTHLLASHEAEVRTALAAGFDARAIAYQRPVLDPREIGSVVRLGVRRFHAFRTSDLDVLADAAARHGCLLRVSLRIALPRVGMSFLAAASRRLGFDANDVPGTGRPGLAIDALNAYLGTQIERAEAYRPAVRALARIAARAGTIEELNLGGGAPSATLRRLTPTRLLRRDAPPHDLPLVEWAASLRRIFDREAGTSLRLALEPGRSIAGNAAVMVTAVAALQGRWVFLDGGRNVLVESPLAFTRRIALLDGRGRPSRTVHLSGPTLNTLDVVDMGRRLPAVRVGDHLAIADAGAYAMSRATRYAGLLPAVVLVRADGGVEALREAESAGTPSAVVVGV